MDNATKEAALRVIRALVSAGLLLAPEGHKDALAQLIANAWKAPRQD